MTGKTDSSQNGKRMQFRQEVSIKPSFKNASINKWEK